MADITGSTYFDFPTSESVHTSSVMRANHENFGISLLSYIEAEILRYFISISGNDGNNTSREMSVPQKVGVAVGTLFLTSVELKIYCML